MILANVTLCFYNYYIQYTVTNPNPNQIECGKFTGNTSAKRTHTSINYFKDLPLWSNALKTNAAKGLKILVLASDIISWILTRAGLIIFGGELAFK